jgi:murein DD-endopeptidase MepM/ murein hydrolase activator NlpD
VPDGTGRVKQLTVSRLLLVSLFMLLSLSVIALFLTIQAYSDSKSPRLEELRRENALLKEELLQIASKIDQFTQEMTELREMDRQLMVVLNLESVESSEQFQGVGGSDPALFDPETTVAQVDRGLVMAMHRSLEHLNSDIELSREDKARLQFFLENQKTRQASMPSIWPANGWLSSSFGYRDSPFTGEREFHKGVDISTRTGEPIVASAEGVVSFTGWDGGFGQVVIIEHSHGFKTTYAHLKKFIVKEGQHVKRGETIGLVGSSGRSTGPHLHYEVHLNGVAVNPIRYVLR